MKFYFLFSAILFISCAKEINNPSTKTNENNSSQEIMEQRIRSSQKLNSALQRAMLKNITDASDSEFSILFKSESEFSDEMRTQLSEISINANFTTSTIATTKASVSSILKLHDLDWVTSIELSQSRQRK